MNKRKFIITIVVLGITAIGSTTVLGLNGYFGGGGPIPEDTFTRGLVGYWNFEEGAGVTAADSSGNSNDTAPLLAWILPQTGCLEKREMAEL